MYSQNDVCLTYHYNYLANVIFSLSLFFSPITRPFFRCNLFLRAILAKSGKSLLEFILRWFIHPFGMRSADGSSCLLSRNKEHISAFFMEHQHCSPSLQTMSSSATIVSNSCTQHSVQSGTGSVQPVSGYTTDVSAAGNIYPSKWKYHINWNQLRTSFDYSHRWLQVLTKQFYDLWHCVTRVILLCRVIKKDWYLYLYPT